MKFIPNTITSLNLLSGCIGCFYVIENPGLGILFITVSGVLDFFDGFAARMLKVQSEIGKQLDSLADLVSFGFLPAFSLVMLLKSEVEMEYVFLVPFLIVIFSALRLARFNVTDESLPYFQGLPTPANAIMISTIVYQFPDYLDLTTTLGMTIISCLLLVSNIKMLNLKFKTFAFKENLWRYLLIISSILGFAFIGLSFISFLIPMYIVFSIFAQTIKLNQ